jgi:hypothetical protein
MAFTRLQIPADERGNPLGLKAVNKHGGQGWTVAITHTTPAR